MIKIFTVAFIAAAIMTAACPNDEYCSYCDGTKCVLCVNSYNNNGVCTAVTTAVAGCTMYSNATTCSDCGAGYNLVGNTCVEITIDNCDILDPLSKTVACLACGNGKLVSGGACKDGASCDLENCSNCLTATTCYECKTGYSVVSTTGKCIKDPIDNCALVTGAVCTGCDHGYYDNATACKSTDMQDGSSIISAFVSLMVMMKLIA